MKQAMTQTVAGLAGISDCVYAKELIRRAPPQLFLVGGPKTPAPIYEPPGARAINSVGLDVALYNTTLRRRLHCNDGPLQLWPSSIME
jgi:hypothetical protein